MSRSRPRAVIADDSHFMRSVISDILAEGGIDAVAQARNGREAVTAVQEHEPDVVTMDVEMPEISDPLMHIIRNALDHGIEPPEKRVEVGDEEYGIPIKNVDEIYPIVNLVETFDVPGRQTATDGGNVDGDGNIVHILDVVTL